MNTENENVEETEEGTAAAPAAEAPAPEAAEAPAPASNDALNALDEMEEGDKVAMEYFKPESGDITRCYYQGTTTFTNKKGESVPAAKLQLKDGTFAICASKVLVDDLSNLEVGTPVQIVQAGEGTSGSGNTYHKWEVTELKPKA